MIVDDTQKSQIRHSSSADLETIWNESGEDYDDKNAKGKKISRVWGLINKKVGKCNLQLRGIYYSSFIFFFVVLLESG